MRCCNCASDCKTFTMSFRRNEEHYEEALDCSDRAAGHCVVCVTLWRVGDASVELVVAAALRLAHDHLLARSRIAPSQPHPVRQLGFWRRESRAAGTQGEVGQDDSRGARKATSGLGWGVRISG